MMNHPSHHPSQHPNSGGYPPPPSMYGGGPPGGPNGPPGPPGMPGSSHGMPPGPSGSHHPMHPSQGPPPPPPSHGGHHGGHHLGRGPPPGQSNGIPPPGGPSPRIMSGAPVPPPLPHGADVGSSMPPPPPRSASAASQHHLQHGHPGGPGGPYDVNAGAPNQPISMAQKLAHSNEQAWIAIGSAAEAMEDYDRAIAAYDSALRHNPYSVPAMNAIAGVHRTMDRFEKAVDFFQRVLNIVPENGETWGAMGHCYLMMDDLQKAYTAYQQALYHLPNPKEPKLWYGIGILYDRYGSLEHAEEAFASVVRMDPNYEKANEIYFRLGIIYKQQNKYQASLECFQYILNNPPRPLTEIDIWFQIGHVHEQQKEFGRAKEAYERVLNENPSHAKVLQQLGWLYHQSNAGFENQDMAIQFLTKSLESDANDAQSWYLLGRAYMAERNYNKAYEAYQQAVYRDGKNPTFWCSIGVLYYQISQYRDALDAYSRAIRLNPYISEVWFDLGSLYESCNNQISDAIDAYARAAELDPDNPHIQQRLTLLRNAEARGEQVSSAPMPQDVHPTAYANHPGSAGGPPPGPYSGGAHLSGEGGPRDLHGSHGPGGRRHSQSPGPGGHGFRDGPPPSIPNIEESGSRHPSQHALAPMEAPRPGQSPPPHYGNNDGSRGGGPNPQHGRTSPRSQAYSSRNADYERERMRERDLAWERGPHTGSGPGPHGGEYGPPGSYDDRGRGQQHYMGGPPPPMHQQQYGQQYDPMSDQNNARNGPPPTNSKSGNNSTKTGPRGSKGGRGEDNEQTSVDSTASAIRKKGGPKSDSRTSSPQVANRGAAASVASPAIGGRGKKSGKTDISRASPASDSSTGSNRPLAAGTNNSNQAPTSRNVDEDYDGSAADALMGLAGAASASAPLSHTNSKPAEASNTVPPIEPKPTVEENQNRMNGDSQEDRLTDAEKFNDIKQRAEAAAAAEERAEEKGGNVLQTLGKRSAESDNQENGQPEKRIKNDDENQQKDEEKIALEPKEAEKETPIEPKQNVVEEEKEKQPSPPKDVEMSTANESNPLEAAKEMTSALNKAMEATGDLSEKVETAEPSEPVKPVESEKQNESEVKENGEVKQTEVSTAVENGKEESKVDEEKIEGGEKAIVAEAPIENKDGIAAEPERPQSRAQSELEEGEVA